MICSSQLQTYLYRKIGLVKRYQLFLKPTPKPQGNKFFEGFVESGLPTKLIYHIQLEINLDFVGADNVTQFLQIANQVPRAYYLRQAMGKYQLPVVSAAVHTRL